MVYTVRDALKLEPLIQAKVVAGKNGLDREVHFVNIMEVPDVRRWMKGGEFLVTAGFAFREDPSLFDTILDELDAVGVAAFGIKLGPYVESMPAELIKHADRLNIPLIELPIDIPYMDYMIPIFERLMLSQYRVLRRVEAIHDKLIALALHGEGIKGICQTLGEILDTPIFVLDKVANCRAQFCAATDSDINQLLETEMKERFPMLVKRNVLISQHINRIVYEPIGHLIVVPIEIDGAVGSYLVAYEDGKKLDEISMRALEHAATVIALEIMRERAVFDNIQHIRSELLEDLILKKYSSMDSILKRASYCDLNIHAKLAIFAADVNDFDRYIHEKHIDKEEEVQKIKQSILVRFRYCLTATLGYTPLLMQRSDSVVGIIVVSHEHDEVFFKCMFEDLLQEISQEYIDLKVTVGIGEVREGIHDLDKSYEEAFNAIRVSNYLNGPGKVAFSENQGAYKFLCDLGRSPAMKEHYDNTIGKLHDYDQKSSTDLVHTLQVYFESNKNVRQTAESLFMHRNSVIYRLKKIEEITQMKLDDSEDQFNLQLVLRLGVMVLGPE